MTEVDPATPTSSSGAPSWREQVVERSLRDARAKAVDRSDRFLAAATDLLGETGTPEFTVQQLVERTGMGLRSFYQHFGGKDELLLVLFQESLRTAADTWRRDIADLDGPVAKMQAVVAALYTEPVTTVPGDGERAMRALALYHLQLADRRPADFALVVTPLKELLRDIIEEGVASGVFRSDIAAEPLTVLVMQSLMAAMIFFLLHDDLMNEPLGQDQLWRFLAAALTATSGTGA